MTVIHMFRMSPLAGVAFLFCCIALALAFVTVRKRTGPRQRFIIGFIGLVAVEDALRLLQASGTMLTTWPKLQEVTSVLVAALILVALLVTRRDASDMNQANLYVRFLESNRRPHLRSQQD